MSDHISCSSIILKQFRYQIRARAYSAGTMPRAARVKSPVKLHMRRSKGSGCLLRSETYRTARIFLRRPRNDCNHRKTRATEPIDKEFSRMRRILRDETDVLEPSAGGPHGVPSFSAHA
jgi:hypothetical protein